GLTSHQIGLVLRKPVSTIWLWFGVGTIIGAAGGPCIFPKDTSVLDRSTEEACMVQVPGTWCLGSGHWVMMAELTFFFQASGTAPNSLINSAPSVAPQSSPRLPPFVQRIASPGSSSRSTVHMVGQ